MAISIIVKYHLREDFELSEQHLRSFYENLSEVGWSYESEEYETGYFTDTEWIYGSSFSEAIEAVADYGGGAIKINKDKIEGFFSFNATSELKLFFDSTHFKDVEKWDRDGEKNSRQIIELIKFLCKELKVDNMHGGPETSFVGGNDIKWVNYFSNETIESLSSLNLSSTSAEFVEKIGDGVFIAPMLRPPGIGDAEQIKSINQELNLC